MRNRAAVPLLVLVLLALAAVLILLVGRSGSKSVSTDQSSIREAIERYDQLLAEGYRTMNMNPLQEVATQLQAEDEYVHMSSLGEGGVRLLPELKKLQFVKVSIESTGAVAETLETWDYTHESLVTKKVVLIQKGLVYRLAWDLRKDSGGRWLVGDVRAISATETVKPKQVGTLTPLPFKRGD